MKFYNEQTLNPYLVALSLLSKRLLWDFQPASWRSRSRLKILRNRYAGQKAVILCNGPSLLSVDFSKLKDVYTFGLNKINLLFDKTDFRPNCIVAVNPYVVEQNINFYNETSLPLFLDADALKKGISKKKDDCVFLHSCRYPGFSQDCSISVFQGYTVTYVAIQLAFHMGFQDVALVGCDHEYHIKGPENQLRKENGIDRSHFDEKYFSAGQLWQLPDLHQSETYYKIAAKIYQGNNRRLLNATHGGKLEIFPRIQLDDFLKSH